MIDKAAVTEVFEALGPERVARGLANADGHTWEDCFLARAYGAPEELEQAMRRDPSRRVANLLGLSLAAADAARLLGVRWMAVAAVVDAFDNDTAEFRQLAEEWLEENYVRGRPRLEEARRGRSSNRHEGIPEPFTPGAVPSCSRAAR